MSVTASLPEIRRRNPALRILYYAACLLLVALIVGVWWLYWIARSPLPQLDGSVSVPGISGGWPTLLHIRYRGCPTLAFFARVADRLDGFMV